MSGERVPHRPALDGSLLAGGGDVGAVVVELALTVSVGLLICLVVFLVAHDIFSWFE